MKKRHLKPDQMNLGDPLPLPYLTPASTTTNNNPATTTTTTSRKPPYQSRNITPREIDTSTSNGEYILRPTYPPRPRYPSKQTENKTIGQQRETVKSKLRHLIAQLDNIEDESQLVVINNKIEDLLTLLQGDQGDGIFQELERMKSNLKKRVKYKEKLLGVAQRLKYPLIFILVVIGLYLITSLILADFAYQYCYYFC